MSQPSRLGNYNIIAFVYIVDVSRAMNFYRDILGLRLVTEEPPFALVFEANGIMLRLGMAKELPPAHGTVLGWQVPEIAATVENLGRFGVRFERLRRNESGRAGHLEFTFRREGCLVQGSRRECLERHGISELNK
jgi:catechol 2,3-dioxygenase-like lactoylglutathione lyase family enzyme